MMGLVCCTLWKYLGNFLFPQRDRFFRLAVEHIQGPRHTAGFCVGVGYREMKDRWTHCSHAKLSDFGGRCICFPSAFSLPGHTSQASPHIKYQAEHILINIQFLVHVILTFWYGKHSHLSQLGLVCENHPEIGYRFDVR